MEKAARIRPFIEYEKKNNVLVVKKCTNLFEKLVNNVTKAYKSFHANREPKIRNFEISSKEEQQISDQGFIKAFSQFKESHELPFSAIQEIHGKPNNLSFRDSVLFPNQHLLKTMYFISSSFTKETFHQIQRHHKIWWMRLGTNPGKYSISDQKLETPISKFVTIRTNFGDNLIDVEKIKTFPVKHCVKDDGNLQEFLCRAPNKKNETLPDIIETVIDLQVASLALLSDAINLSEDYLALHRCLAPYQLVVVVQKSSKDLKDLARYIELLVTETDPSIAVFTDNNENDTGQDDMKIKLKRYDDIGVPYSIILDETALAEGLFRLRSRNTTLSETIHLSDVTIYLTRIFKSG